MKSRSIISLDTFKLRQETIIRHIKPKEIPHKKVMGIRAHDDPAGYIDRNKNVLETHRQELIQFLWEHPWSDIIINYYFAILPETWQFIQEQQEKIADVFLITCQEDFYTKYAEPNQYPIKPHNIIAYSDDHGRRRDDLQYALRRQ